MKRKFTLIWVLGLTIIASVVIINSCSPDSVSQSYAGMPDVVDFNFHIKPILSDRCYQCHGPDEKSRKAELRLDTREGALGKGESGKYAIKAGKPHKSELFNRLTTHDPDDIMPPSESGLIVTDYEKALIEKWIDQGAKWKDHWAFIPPQKAKLPKVQNKKWAKNEIDQFILAKLEQTGLSPSEEAAKEALIRRVSFDLTGLPPTLEEIDNFVNDNSENAYEKVVDRLLSSESYGERMASDWLNVARYGDTHGYEADSKRMAWQWRDWVIKAFNKNLPYNQFITEQMAGDLLANPTRDQIIATSFNRNHLMNSENGILDEEWRVEYVSDRTNTAGKAILGLTMECAKCHDHKYDPISQKEYYGMFAFFNNVDEPGQIRYESQVYPLVNLTNDMEQKELEKLESLCDEQREEITSYVQNLKKEREWESKVNKKINLKKGLKVHISFDKLRENKDGYYFANKAEPGRPLTFTGDANWVDGAMGKGLGYDGINETVFKDAKNSYYGHEAFSYSFWVNYPEPFKQARFMGTDDGSFDKVPGYYLHLEEDKVAFQISSTWDYNFIKVKAKESFPFQKWTHITVTYDGSSKAVGVKMYMDGKPLELNVLKDNLTKKINPFAWFKIGHSTMQGGALDEFRQYDRVLTLPEIQTLAQKEVTEEGWFDYYVHNGDKSLSSMRDSLKSMIFERISLLDTVPQLMVMKDLEDSIRPTYILNRGVYDDRGAEVHAHTPEAVLSFSDSLPKNRYGFAEWLFAPEQPLTSRVMVNRMWQMIFGKGLVSTPDDFGNQGSLPTHPELLDWLSVDLRENGWDMKALYKKMVMSATYLQASDVSPEKLNQDPNNDLLARGPRYRLTAEMIRDNALAVSGLLVNKIGGEPVKPYQPAGIWAQVSTARTPYDQDHGEKLYRRSLYTYWKRAVPPPNMTTLDAPTRHTCTVKREATSTPLQALIMLNDVQFVEAARVFAERVMKHGGEELDDRITYAFRIATARKPSQEELVILKTLYNDSKEEFKKHASDVKQLLKAGEYPVDKNLNQLEIATYTMITSAILNMNETITKG